MIDVENGKQIAEIYISSYNVERTDRRMEIRGDVTYSDGSGSIFNVEVNNDEQEFDEFYSTFDSDLKLYLKVAEKLDISGSIILDNEPQ